MNASYPLPMARIHGETSYLVPFDCDEEKEELEAASRRGRKWVVVSYEFSDKMAELIEDDPKPVWKECWVDKYGFRIYDDEGEYITRKARQPLWEARALREKTYRRNPEKSMWRTNVSAQERQRQKKREIKNAKKGKQAHAV